MLNIFTNVSMSKIIMSHRLFLNKRGVLIIELIATYCLHDFGRF